MEKFLEDVPPWKTLETTYPLVTKWLRLRRDRVLTHSGGEIIYTFIEHPGSVLIVPLTSDGDILLLRQYRYTTNSWFWEIPAGSVEEQNCEQAAQRELYEEIGGRCAHLLFIGKFYSSNSTSNEACIVYLAQGVEVEQSHPEASELLYSVAFPYQKVLEMARRGEITDGPSALAILVCEPFIENCMGKEKAKVSGLNKVDMKRAFHNSETSQR